MRQMARQLICDICKKPTSRLVAKLFLSPRNGRSSWNNYVAHADVGECCGSKIPEIARWQKRATQGTPTKKRTQRARTDA